MPIEIPPYQGPVGPVQTGPQRQPIGGMPPTYRTPYRPTGGPATADRAERGQGPLYWTDDEWTPARWSPEKIATLQRDLAAVGLIGARERVTWGVWDPASATAYRELLGYANTVGLPWQRALDLFASQPAPEDARQPLVKRLTNPADLRTAFKQTLTRVAGEAPPEMVERLIKAYQGQEGAVQEQIYNAAETGGTVVDAPSVEGFAEDQARRQMPVQTGAVDVLEQLNAMNNWLGFD